MKITRKQLRRIINEELNASLLIERSYTSFKKGDKILATWEDDGVKYPGIIDKKIYSVSPYGNVFKYSVIWDNPGNGPLKSNVNEIDIEPATEDIAYQPEDTSGESLQKEILWKVIADEGRSKDWDHLISLDGGSVGIAHFAAGGIYALYDEFGDEGVRKWFSRYNTEIDSVHALKDATKTSDGHCRSGSASAGPGTCWNMRWWKDGMLAFLADSESRVIQFRAWQALVVKKAEVLIGSYGGLWSTNRGRAIAYSLVNSGSPSLLRRLSSGGLASPNDTMEKYNREKGRVRTRMRVLNKLYPDPNFNPTYMPAKYI